METAILQQETDSPGRYHNEIQVSLLSNNKASTSTQGPHEASTQAHPRTNEDRDRIVLSIQFS